MSSPSRRCESWKDDGEEALDKALLVEGRIHASGEVSRMHFFMEREEGSERYDEDLPVRYNFWV